MEDHLNNKDRLNKEWEASIGMSFFFFFLKYSMTSGPWWNICLGDCLDVELWEPRFLLKEAYNSLLGQC